MSRGKHGRAFPPLVVVAIEDVQPGDILWGWEQGANYTRKGWTVEPEGQELWMIQDLEDRWVFNNTQMLKGRYCPRYALIEGEDS